MKQLKYIVLLTLMSVSLNTWSQGVAGLTGQFQGKYKITMRAYPTGAVLGYGVQFADWFWDFDAGIATVSGTTLTVGFNYVLHDVGNSSLEDEILYITDNQDGTYTLDYSLQIYHPGLGNPMALASTRFSISQQGDNLTISTIDWENDGELDDITGTQIPNVFPLTIEPDLQGVATRIGADSNQDGLQDELAIMLGLDPLKRDSDGDGIDDIIELGENFTAPLDSDLDGVIDALEPGLAATDNTLVAGLLAEDGQTLTLTVSQGWYFSGVNIAAMQREVDNLDSKFDIANTDSSLGQAGLNYPLGNIYFSLTAEKNTQEQQATVGIRLADVLPEKPLLYAIEGDASSELYTLVSDEQWQVKDDKSFNITVFDGDSRDLDSTENGKVSNSIAITSNTLGDIHIDEKQYSGAFNWLLFIIVLFIYTRSKSSSVFASAT